MYQYIMKVPISMHIVHTRRRLAFGRLSSGVLGKTRPGNAKKSESATFTAS